MAKTRPDPVQIFFESNRGLFAGKLDGDDDRPRAMLDGLTRRPRVVPVKAGVDIFSEADVVA